mmetsp:Transcript_97685/g.291762  ORF Transcript_97685/g.291762 Transcript_97685/m.291762 type:complete len:265 (+) Transcript_97685:109-903(+)
MVAAALGKGLLEDTEEKQGQSISARTVAKGILVLGLCLAGLAAVGLAGIPRREVALTAEPGLAVKLGATIRTLHTNVTMRRPVRNSTTAAAVQLYSLDVDDSIVWRPETVTFDDIESGVLYMARLLATSVSDPPEFLHFLASLTDLSRVQRIFGSQHPVLNGIFPTDLNICIALSIFFEVSQDGTEIQGNMRAALSPNLNYHNVVVTTLPFGGIEDAWTRKFSVISDTVVDRAITTGCKKEFSSNGIETTLEYACRSAVSRIDP